MHYEILRVLAIMTYSVGKFPCVEAPPSSGETEGPWTCLRFDPFGDSLILNIRHSSTIIFKSTNLEITETPTF